MNELLSNTAVQAALVLVIVTGLQFLVVFPEGDLFDPADSATIDITTRTVPSDMMTGMDFGKRSWLKI